MRRFQTLLTFGLAVLGPLLAVATLLALGPLDGGAGSTHMRLILLLADFVYVLLIAALVFSRVMRMVADRRRRSADRACTCV